MATKKKRQVEEAMAPVIDKEFAEWLHEVGTEAFITETVRKSLARVGKQITLESMKATWQRYVEKRTLIHVEPSISEEELRELYSLLTDVLEPRVVYRHRDERTMLNDAWSAVQWKALDARSMVRGILNRHLEES